MKCYPFLSRCKNVSIKTTKSATMLRHDTNIMSKDLNKVNKPTINNGGCCQSSRDLPSAASCQSSLECLTSLVLQYCSSPLQCPALNDTESDPSNKTKNLVDVDTAAILSCSFSLLSTFTAVDMHYFSALSSFFLLSRSSVV